MEQLLSIVNEFEVTDFAVSEKDRKYLDAVNVKVTKNLVEKVTEELGETHELTTALEEHYASGKLLFNIIPLAVAAGATHFSLNTRFFVGDDTAEAGWRIQ